ncbi:MAG: hypothetical protein LBL69_05690 [Zoogloeaceae bacterium]|jgi:hypothetical protein|nr:hypothetical protein [Zoogloeaceae bacterium]
MSQSLARLLRVLSQEAGWTKANEASPTAKALRLSRAELLNAVREVGQSGDLAWMVAAEKTIIEGDLERYANSHAMKASLKTALLELEAIETLLDIVDDATRYAPVDSAYSLPKHRENGLPKDQARQAFKSHHARLSNMDKSRLSDSEKAVIEARKANLLEAAKHYALRQAKTLGIVPGAA